MNAQVLDASQILMQMWAKIFPTVLRGLILGSLLKTQLILDEDCYATNLGQADVAVA